MHNANMKNKSVLFLNLKSQNQPYGFYNHYKKQIVLNCSKNKSLIQKGFTLFHELLHKLTDFENPILTYICSYIIDSTNNITIRLIHKEKCKLRVITWREQLEG